MATIAQLRAILNSKYLKVGNPVPLNGGQADEHNIKEYVVNVVEEGATLENIPLMVRHNITVAVMDQGLATENAAFKVAELPSQAKKSLVVDNSLASINRIYADSEMRNRVQSAIGKAAQDILNEDVATANHAERLKFALEALTSSRNYIEMFMRFVSLNPTVQTNGGEATDNDLQYIVNSSIDKIALALFGV